MAATYIQLNLKIQPLETGREITLAVLSELGFESFVETEVGLEAYIQEKDWQADLLDHLYPLAEKGLDISWSLTAIPPENWNAVWESDFQPIIIENQCAVRANFHDPIDVPYELVITPKDELWNRTSSNDLYDVELFASISSQRAHLTRYGMWDRRFGHFSREIRSERTRCD